MNREIFFNLTDLLNEIDNLLDVINDLLKLKQKEPDNFLIDGCLEDCKELYDLYIKVFDNQGNMDEETDETICDLYRNIDEVFHIVTENIYEV